MPIIIDEKEYLTDSEVSEMLHITTQNLGQWRSRKKPHIPFLKIGKKIYYEKSDIRVFLEQAKNKE
jgi:Helix-turn-helix domain